MCCIAWRRRLPRPRTYRSTSAHNLLAATFHHQGWGAVADGALGQLARGVKHSTPGALPSTATLEVAQVAAGSTCTVVMAGGHVFHAGALHAAERDKSVRQIPELDDVAIEHIAAAAEWALGVDAEGAVWGWGMVPTQLEQQRAAGGDAGELQLTGIVEAAGQRVGRSAAIYQASAAAWLNGSERASREELAAGVMSMRVLRRATVPRVIPGLAGIVITRVAAGYAHCIALSAAGKAWGMGYNDRGQLGCGTRLATDKFTPVQDGDKGPHKTWAAVACGAAHTLLVAEDGSLYACGSDSLYQLGVDRFRYVSTVVPRLVELPVGVGQALDESVAARGHAAHPKQVRARFAPFRVVSVAAGSNHSAAVTADGAVWTWGHAEYNQTKPPAALSQMLPRLQEQVQQLADMRAGVLRSMAAAGLSTEQAEALLPSWAHVTPVDDGRTAEISAEQDMGGVVRAAPHPNRLPTPMRMPGTGTHAAAVIRAASVHSAPTANHSAIITQHGGLVMLGHNDFNVLGWSDASLRDLRDLVADVTHTMEAKARAWQRAALGASTAVLLSQKPSPVPPLPSLVDLFERRVCVRELPPLPVPEPMAMHNIPVALGQRHVIALPAAAGNIAKRAWAARQRAMSSAVPVQPDVLLVGLPTRGVPVHPDGSWSTVRGQRTYSALLQARCAGLVPAGAGSTRWCTLVHAHALNTPLWSGPLEPDSPMHALCHQIVAAHAQDADSSGKLLVQGAGTCISEEQAVPTRGVVLVLGCSAAVLKALAWYLCSDALQVASHLYTLLDTVAAGAGLGHLRALIAAAQAGNAHVNEAGSGAGTASAVPSYRAAAVAAAAAAAASARSARIAMGQPGSTTQSVRKRDQTAHAQQVSDVVLHVAGLTHKALSPERSTLDASEASEESTWSTDMLRLLHTELLADCRVVCADGEVIHAHRAVLSLLPRFVVSLKREWQRSTSHMAEVSLPGTTGHAARTLLEYLYSGDSEVLAVPHALDVLHAAHRWSFDSAVAALVQLIVSVIAPDNAGEVLRIGEALHIPKLIAHAAAIRA